MIEEDQEQRQLRLQNAVNRGQRAKALLEDPIMIEALETLDAQYVEHIRETKPWEDEKLKCAHTMLHACALFKKHFEIILEDGEAARHELKRFKI